MRTNISMPFQICPGELIFSILLASAIISCCFFSCKKPYRIIVVCEQRLFDLWDLDLCPPADNSPGPHDSSDAFLAFCAFSSPKEALLLAYPPAGLHFIPVSRQTSYLLSSHSHFNKIYITFTENWKGSQTAYNYWKKQ